MARTAIASLVALVCVVPLVAGATVTHSGTREPWVVVVQDNEQPCDDQETVYISSTPKSYLNSPILNKLFSSNNNGYGLEDAYVSTNAHHGPVSQIEFSGPSSNEHFYIRTKETQMKEMYISSTPLPDCEDKGVSDSTFAIVNQQANLEEESDRRGDYLGDNKNDLTYTINYYHEQPKFEGEIFTSSLSPPVMLVEGLPVQYEAQAPQSQSFEIKYSGYVPVLGSNLQIDSFAGNRKDEEKNNAISTSGAGSNDDSLMVVHVTTPAPKTDDVLLAQSYEVHHSGKVAMQSIPLNQEYNVRYSYDGSSTTNAPKISQHLINSDRLEMHGLYEDATAAAFQPEIKDFLQIQSLPESQKYEINYSASNSQTDSANADRNGVDQFYELHYNRTSLMNAQNLPHAQNEMGEQLLSGDGYEIKYSSNGELDQSTTKEGYETKYSGSPLLSELNSVNEEYSTKYQSSTAQDVSQISAIENALTPESGFEVKYTNLGMSQSTISPTVDHINMGNYGISYSNKDDAHHIISSSSPAPEQSYEVHYSNANINMEVQPVPEVTVQQETLPVKQVIHDNQPMISEDSLMGSKIEISYSNKDTEHERNSDDVNSSSIPSMDQSYEVHYSNDNENALKHVYQELEEAKGGHAHDQQPISETLGYEFHYSGNDNSINGQNIQPNDEITVTVYPSITQQASYINGYDIKLSKKDRNDISAELNTLQNSLTSTISTIIGNSPVNPINYEIHYNNQDNKKYQDSGAANTIPMTSSYEVRYSNEASSNEDRGQSILHQATSSTAHPLTEFDFLAVSTMAPDALKVVSEAVFVPSYTADYEIKYGGNMNNNLLLGQKVSENQPDSMFSSYPNIPIAALNPVTEIFSHEAPMNIRLESIAAIAPNGKVYEVRYNSQATTTTTKPINVEVVTEGQGNVHESNCDKDSNENIVEINYSHHFQNEQPQNDLHSPTIPPPPTIDVQYVNGKVEVPELDEIEYYYNTQYSNGESFSSSPQSEGPSEQPPPLTSTLSYIQTAGAQSSSEFTPQQPEEISANNQNQINGADGYEIYYTSKLNGHEIKDRPIEMTSTDAALPLSYKINEKDTVKIKYGSNYNPGAQKFWAVEGTPQVDLLTFNGRIKNNGFTVKYGSEDGNEQLYVSEYQQGQSSEMPHITSTVKNEDGDKQEEELLFASQPVSTASSTQAYIASTEGISNTGVSQPNSHYSSLEISRKQAQPLLFRVLGPKPSVIAINQPDYLRLKPMQHYSLVHLKQNTKTLIEKKLESMFPYLSDCIRKIKSKFSLR